MRLFDTHIGESIDTSLTEFALVEAEIFHFQKLGFQSFIEPSGCARTAQDCELRTDPGVYSTLLRMRSWRLLYSTADAAKMQQQKASSITFLHQNWDDDDGQADPIHSITPVPRPAPFPPKERK